MANIAFVLDHEEGHLLPTFKLAARLASRGHAVRYLGLADAEDFVRRQGFEFSPILEDVFPLGSTKTLRERTRGQDPEEETGPIHGVLGAGEISDEYLISLIHGRDLGDAVEDTRPDLFLVNSHFVLHALVLSYRFKIPVVLLTPWLRPFPKTGYTQMIETSLLQLRTAGLELFSLVQSADPTARRFQDIAARFLAMRELIMCPAELELPRDGQAPPEHEVYHVEASVDLARRDDRELPWERLDPNKRLLYCSVGSQSQLVGREKIARFLGAVVEAATGLAGWQLVLATGGMVGLRDLPPLPPDAIATGWVPQLPVLERASAMITHCGLGTVKECIFHGVPMLAVPMMRDQPDNAKRIVHHRLGVACDFETVTAGGIAALIRQLDEDPAIRQSVARMQRRFHEIEDSGVGVQRVEEVLNGKARPAAGHG
ncbi:MAG TPA: nucleotide disphospho-sugar-binding domain-containing protein [Thermoanaerobaculia bacterium]|nr:nucleotide disphospho-sugar-binding domain-containing protein [Thermoanaerobaculia bacterium]